jgi:CheY-like chemotaxis protein/anti-sigma regulatory factor (Ser/Thr protein kinase)
MISADEGKLTQILSNLISNALRFTEKGRVEVRLNKESNSSIRFSVEDTGIGIPEEKLSLIFSKFYQTNGTATREHGSVGLGLTIVKELVDLLGGRMEVKSKPGKGSLFYFSLPCVSSEEGVVPDRDGNGTAPKTEERVKKGVNILIAEDDSYTYDIIRRFLEGCTISRAVDGQDVLKKIKEKSYDMVLMDIQMPRMDGLEAARRIREKDSDLPIIAVTAGSFKADENKCLAAGCNDYITKPIAPQKLIAKINQYATKRPSRRQSSPPK